MTRPAFYNESQAGEFFLPRYDMVTSFKMFL
jgi:hypothetical protein